MRTSENRLISHVLEAVVPLAPRRIVIVTGHKRELVEEAVKEHLLAAGNLSAKTAVSFALQNEQLGTGHAAKCALVGLSGFSGIVLILYGDTPLLKTDTISSLIQFHRSKKATITLLTAKLADPAAYGRVIRTSSDGDVTAVIENRDCSPQQRLIREINVGVYAVDSAFLGPALESIENNNSQREYYLTDIIAKAHREGQTIAGYETLDPAEALGVNDQADLSIINGHLNKARLLALQRSGVSLIDPSSVYLDPQVTIMPSAQIGPNVQLLGNTSIGERVILEGSAWLRDCEIADGAHLKFGVRAEEAKIGRDCAIGPFAHLRPGTVLDAECKIGNFVETKNARLGKDAKASHLTYLGDCEIGESSNIGAGTITCNYDGYKKSKTTVGKNVFIGSNTSLVAPVEIEDGATVGAGSVITKTVEKDSLAFTRAPQVSKAGWSARKRKLVTK